MDASVRRIPSAPMASPDTPPAPSRRRSRTRRRLLRRLAIALALLLLLTVGPLLLLTKSGIAAWFVAPALEGLTGAKVSIDSVTIGLDGTATLRGVRAEAPGVAGEAAEFLDVERLDARFDWGDLLAGRGVKAVTLLQPRLRLSQSTETQTLNVSGLTFLRPGGTGSSGLPTVVIDDASLEVGEHAGSDYTPLTIFHFDASVLPDPASPTQASTIRITPLAPEGPIVGLPGQDITGRIDGDGVTLTPAEVSLASLRPQATPSAVRRELELLDLAGRVRVRTFTYTFASGRIEAEIRLAGVAMNLPVTPRHPEGGYKPLRLTNVNGAVTLRGDSIRANLRGVVGDVPLAARLDYGGPSPDAPFTCVLEIKDYRLVGQPDLLRFAPDVARERLENFSNPTAIVSSTITLTRAEPGPDGPAPIGVQGVVDLRDGVAAYHEFPYRFENLSGTARFDNDKVEIVEITGVSPEGAKLRAVGLISPIGEHAHVDVKVHVTDVPLGDAIAEAMGPDRKEIVTALCNRERMAELVAEGLVLPPAEVARLRDDLARLESMPSRSPEAEARLASIRATLAERPAFEPGGVAVVDVHVIRTWGTESHWTTTVDIVFPTLGVLPEPFPLPIIGTDVKLRVTDDVAVLLGGDYRTLRGGSASVACEADLKRPDGTSDFIPRITIDAQGIPVDDLLIHALPERDGPDDERSGAVSTRDALRGLAIDGAIDIRARIEPRDELGPEGDVDLGYHVEAELAGLRAAPPPADPARALRIDNIRGSLLATHEAVRVDLRSDLSVVMAHAPSASPGRAGAMTLSLDADLRPEDAPAHIVAQALEMDAASPIEDAVRPFSADAAASLAALRERFSPTGRLDAALTLDTSGAGVRGVIDLSHFRDVSFNALQGRTSISVPEGRAIVAVERPARPAEDAPPRPTLITFDGFRAAIDHDGVATGAVSLTGDLAIDTTGQTIVPAETDVAISWMDAPLESPAIAALIRARLGEDASKTYAEHAPAGHFDLDLRLAENPAAPARLGAWGSVRPRHLALTRAGSRVAFPSVGGEVSFRPEGGVVSSLTLNAQGLSLTADGSWSIPPGALPALDLTLKGWADGPGDTVRALLPATLRDMAEDVKLRVDGGLRLESLHLAVTGDPRTSGGVIAASGTLAVRDASLSLGPPVTDLTGALEFVASARADSTSFDVGFMADSLRLAGLRITDARLRVVGDPERPGIIAPLISGTTHGGRIAGRALVVPDARDPAKRRYTASLHVAGARFASVLADLAAARGNGVHTVVGSNPDASRGLLDAELSLTGVVGDHASQTGRGELAISGGEVLSFPLLLTIIQVTNLQVPSREALDLALASFHISRGEVEFEQLSVFSRSIELVGYGTMSWPDADLDLRVISRAARPLPFVSSLLEVIRNELVTIRVSGPLADARVSLDQFSSARGLARRMLGQTPSEQAREMEQIRLRAYDSRDRVRRAGERMKDLGRVPTAEGM